MENKFDEILEKLKEKEIQHNPFSSLPNQRLREALNYLEEVSAEIIPLSEKE